jgi:hypothetical protein
LILLIFLVVQDAGWVPISLRQAANSTLPPFPLAYFAAFFFEAFLEAFFACF